MVEPPLLDVVVSLVNTNNRELTRACLSSLPAAAGSLSYEVWVVDNASTDGSVDMVEDLFPDAVLIRNPRRLGFSANHNQVIASVLSRRLAPYVLVLNEDTEFAPGALRELVDFADARPRAGIAGPAIVGTDGVRQQSAFRRPTVRDHVVRALVPSLGPGKPSRDYWLNGACLLIRTDAIRDVGLLDERFFIFFEDTDLGVRFARHGWASELCESASVLHHGHQTVAQPALGSAMEWQMLRSGYLYFEKHRGRAVAWSVMWLVRFGLLVRSVVAVLETIVRHADCRSDARLLFELALMDPRQKLPHEVDAHRGRCRSRMLRRDA